MAIKRSDKTSALISAESSLYTLTGTDGYSASTVTVTTSWNINVASNSATMYLVYTDVGRSSAANK